MESVAHRVRTHAPFLPPSERLVVRALLANYPAAALDTVAHLAADAGVSAPTVLRLVERIGFASFAELQDALRKELSSRFPVTPDIYAANSAIMVSADAIERSRRVFSTGIADTFASMDQAAFDRAVELMANTDNRLFATGGRFSSVLAKVLVTTLEVLRAKTTYLSVEDRTSMLADFTQDDVLFVADLRRYQWNSIVFGREAKARGAKVIVFTDRWRSPVSDIADAVLTCSVEGPHPLDSMVAAMAGTEALIAGVVDALGSSPAERMRRYDAAWDSVGFSNQYWERFDESAAMEEDPDS